VINIYICRDCGKEFENPVQCEEKYNLDTYPYHRWMGCPVCKGGCYAETEQCDICKKYAKINYITTKDGQVFCQDCYKTYNLEHE
jgi:hypothetical protein